jgi:hypothetical protein
MDLSQLQQHWDAFGRSDPLWAILTDPDRRGNRWDPVEFFETGRQEVAAIFQRAAAFNLPVRRHRALDFGCGVDDQGFVRAMVINEGTEPTWLTFRYAVTR